MVHKWFILPHPNYGSWEEALYNFDRSQSEKEKNNWILQQLTTKEQEKNR
ncbi:MAG: hypothetical protein R3224_08535 [Balneolaceae bacterium]|nr:hypothetical protein [Balneolaceae bacterium]